jgi:two-component system cell cycle sensor histidine kinase/response regulator CckA
MTNRNTLLLATVVGTATAVFLLDLTTPLGIVDSVLFPLVVLLSYWLPRQRHTYITAAVCTVLALVGLVLSPSRTAFWHGLVNHLAGIMVIWVLALFARFDRLRRERFREQATLLDQVPDAVLVQDLEDRVQFWNHGAEKLYGWTVDEVLGRDINDLLFRNRRTELAQVNKAVLEQGTWSGELRQVTKEGREITIEARWVLLRDYQGHPHAKLIVNTDITARKKLEAQLLRTQRLESIGTLAGGIAHDFNNLLNPILMSVKLLQMDRAEADRQRLLNVLQASAERGAEMVRGLLTFAGGADRQLEALSPETVIREVKAILDHTFPKNIRVEAAVAEGLWPVRADPTQFSQVLMNLCVNARDAMSDGGTLTISAENQRIDQRYASQHADARLGPHVLIAVADTGTGIAQDHIDKIFDPFFTTKEQGKGTGLGLSTALGIVKSHGGFINVYSEKGKGTRFALYLPALTDTEDESATTRSVDIPTGQGELILVVDDEPYIRETTMAALKAHNYRVLAACDGSEAVALYREHGAEIRVVLLDMVMPILDGPATMEALRQLDPQVRIIATSGLRASGRVARALAVEDNTFLQKPYTDEQMLAALARVLRAE